MALSASSHLSFAMDTRTAMMAVTRTRLCAALGIVRIQCSSAPLMNLDVCVSDKRIYAMDTTIATMDPMSFMKAVARSNAKIMGQWSHFAAQLGKQEDGASVQRICAMDPVIAMMDLMSRTRHVSSRNAKVMVHRALSHFAAQPGKPGDGA